MVINKDQVFNLMDTNGRRNDVIVALQGYVTILNNVLNNLGLSWQRMPESLGEYEFYKEAVEMFPGVFQQHGPYDRLIAEIDKHPGLKKAMDELDIEWIKNHQNDCADVLGMFDNGIEDRARHYTSNLVKLGFADDQRNISEVGKLLLNPSDIKRDSIEELFPIDNVNVIYLRQLMKVRMYDKDEESYYSPFYMAIYALLLKGRISENAFCELVQGGTPYKCIDKITDYINEFVDNYDEPPIMDNGVIVPAELMTDEKLIWDVFSKKFKNTKSSSTVSTYYVFYSKLYDFNKSRDAASLDLLLSFYEENRETLKKAFGCGRNIFSTRRGDRPEPNDFIEDNSELFEGDLNENIYRRYVQSKKVDQIREYSDTTKRIFKATGIISFDNGYVELAYKELCESIFEIAQIDEKIYGKLSEEVHAHYDCFEEYEGDVNSFFCMVVPFSEILDFTEDIINRIVNKVKEVIGGETIESIPAILKRKREEEFAEFINDKYPEASVKLILSMFSDRVANDKKIKDAVSPDADVPTIYEYMVGIAWYYFSGKTINLLQSFNMSLSANFEPLVHAGGGQGDIVIREDDKVVMLEVTLMNANAQKRGEWEPVLRHATNLQIEEEEREDSKPVTTFFIADEFDSNTINIWKAICSVPMQSSTDKTKYTDNVIIMPVNTVELCKLMDKSNLYNDIISDVREMFKADTTSFDMTWRDRFVNKIMA